MFSKRAKTISGETISEPRLTLTAVRLAVVWIGLPILVIGGLMDLVMQLVFGVCTGLWCYAS